MRNCQKDRYAALIRKAKQLTWGQTWGFVSQWLAEKSNWRVHRCEPVYPNDWPHQLVTRGVRNLTDKLVLVWSVNVYIRFGHWKDYSRIVKDITQILLVSWDVIPGTVGQRITFVKPSRSAVSLFCPVAVASYAPENYFLSIHCAPPACGPIHLCQDPANARVLPIINLLSGRQDSPDSAMTEAFASPASAR